MSAKKKILVVDENTEHYCEIKNLFEDGYDVLNVATFHEAQNYINNSSKNLTAIIIELINPETDGFKFIEHFYADIKNANIPLIITTSIKDKSFELDALKLGAWDYLIRPYDGEILKFRLTNSILRCKLNNFNRIKYLAEFDTLTGIYNKNKFFDMTKDMLSRFSDRRFVFIRVDIDRFKLVNTFFGADEGDKILRYIADGFDRKMKKRRRCTYGRINSDRFGICMEVDEDPKEFLELFTEKFRYFLSRYEISYKLVFSVGAYFIDDNKMPVNMIYDRATMAANKCKGSDMILYTIYDKKMSDELIVTQEMSNEMHDALLDGQFVVYLQPKYDLKTNKISGAEALVRWLHPKKGLVPPDEFISVFEKNGFIQKLDEFVWETSCKYVRSLLDDGIKSFPISVNMSRVDTLNALLCENLNAIVSKYGLSPKDLSIEITESAYMEDGNQMIDTINDLKQSGFTLEMDDFGKGYSSLNMLSELPIDKLKLDMRFLQKKTSLSSHGIIKLIVDFAKTLNMKVVAEGIETKEDVNFLKDIGCGYGQGYYFSKPLPFECFRELVIQDQ